MADLTWKDRAVSSWRQNQLQLKLRALLDVEIDPEGIQTSADTSTISIDGVKFILEMPEGALTLKAPCPSCGKPQHSGKLENIADVGRSLDTPCRDCDFLVKSGLRPGAAKTA